MNMKVEKAMHRGEDLLNQGLEMADQVKKNAKHYGKATVRYVKKYPVQSALIAVGVGFLFGKIFR